MNDRPRAVIYARVSTTPQAEDGYGLAFQMRETRRWAEQQGYDVVAEVQEPGYAREDYHRPGLDEIRRLVAAGFDGDVLAWKRDRYSDASWVRDLLDNEFSGYGVRLRAIDDPMDGDSPAAELSGSMIDAANRFQRRVATERMRAGKREKAHAGRWVGSGSPPYGFSYRDGELSVDPVAAHNVKRIFQIVGRDGHTVSSVVAAFHKEGIPSPKGSRYWYPSTIKRIIDNDAYLGTAYYNKRRVKTISTLDGKIYKATVNDREDWIPVPVPDLGIPPDWIEAARRNTGNGTVTNPNADRDWMLRGHAVCACGRKMLCTYTRNRYGKKRHYYVCPNKRSNRNPKCEHGRFRKADKLEQSVWAFVVDYLVNNPDELHKRFEAYITSICSAVRDDRLPILHEQISRIEAKRQKAIDAYLDGPLSKQDVSARLADLDEQKAACEREIAALRDSEARAAGLRQVADYVMRAVAEVRDTTPNPEKLKLWHYNEFQRRRIRDLYRNLELKVISQADGVEISGIFGQHFLPTSS